MNFVKHALLFWGVAGLCLAQNPALAQSATPLGNLSISELDSLYEEHQANKNPESALMCAQALVAQTEKRYGKEAPEYRAKQLVLAQAHYWLGQYASAQALLQSIGQVKTEKNDLYYECLEWQFLNAVQNHQPEQAAKAFDELLPHEKAGKKPDECLNFTGAAANQHLALGQTEEAIRTTSSVKQQLERLGEQNSVLYCDILANLAWTLYEDGRIAETEQLLQQALELRKKLQPEVNEKHVDDWVSMALINEMGKGGGDAQTLFLKAEALCREHLGTGVEAYGWVCLKYADFCRRRGENEQAIAWYQKALPVFEKNKTKLSDGYTFSLNNLATAYSNLKQFDRALALFGEVLSLKEKLYGKKHYEYFYTINSITRLHLRMQNPDMALRYALLGLSINTAQWGNQIPEFSEELIAELPRVHYYSNTNMFSSLVNMLNVCELYYQQTKDMTWVHKAYQLCRAALAINENFKNALNNESDQLATLSLHSSYCKRGILQSQRLYEQSGDARYLDDALAFSEQGKAVVLSDALKSQRARRMSDLPAELAAQELYLKQNLASVQKLLIESKDEAFKNQLRTRFVQQSEELEAFKKRLEREHPQYFALKYASNSVSSKEIQAALPPNTALLAYQVSDTTTRVFVLTEKSFELLALPLRMDSLHQQAALLRKNLSDYKYIRDSSEQSYTGFAASAHWFYAKLLQPALSKHTDIQHLVVVPDNVLAHLPFEVFLTQAAPEQANYKNLDYLIKKYAVTYSYSAALWLENGKMRPADEQPAQFLGMAASYGLNPALGKLPRSPQQLTLRSTVEDLPEAQKEVRRLEDMFQGTFLYGEQATEANFKRHASQAGIIHLAMHGILNQKNPILSSLVLTENGDTAEDNFLQAYEIAHLDLSARLVVLSACETGYGKFQQGEGVMSLARSFMLAGVPALAVSLWEVNDASTQQIMAAFYGELMGGASKSTAMQNAKLEYLNRNNGIAAHPAFWSAFVLQGNDAPMALSAKTTTWVYWLAGGGLGLAALSLLFLNKKRR